MATKEFEIINRWLGLGDPRNGLWFVGIEEGGVWPVDSPEKIKETRVRISSEYNRTYTSFEKAPANTFPIATVTAKIACQISQTSDWRKYRNKILWLEGSQVFNTNLYSLGKKTLSKGAWPKGYRELFGFGADDLTLYINEVKQLRFKELRKFHDKNTPQAIICFGMSNWDEFIEVFSLQGNGIDYVSKYQTRIFEKEKTILTRHFSNGMPNKTVKFIGSYLKRWNIQVL